MSGECIMQMVWGGMAVTLLVGFIFVCLYAASALVDLKRAARELKHD